MLVSVALVLLGVFINTHIEALDTLGPAWELLVDVFEEFAMWIAFPLLFYVFPDGRFVPRWSVLAWIGWVYTQVPYFIAVSIRAWSFSIPVTGPKKFRSCSTPCCS